MAQVVFFAAIREALGVERLTVRVTPGEKLAGLVARLADEHGREWREQLTAENVRVAVNQELVDGDPPLHDSDEIAFFPPVTGG